MSYLKTCDSTIEIQNLKLDTRHHFGANVTEGTVASRSGAMEANLVSNDESFPLLVVSFDLLKK